MRKMFEDFMMSSIKAVIKIGFLREMFSSSNATIDSWNKQVFLLSVCSS